MKSLIGSCIALLLFATGTACVAESENFLLLNSPYLKDKGLRAARIENNLLSSASTTTGAIRSLVFLSLYSELYRGLKESPSAFRLPDTSFVTAAAGLSCSYIDFNDRMLNHLKVTAESSLGGRALRFRGEAKTPEQFGSERERSGLLWKLFFLGGDKDWLGVVATKTPGVNAFRLETVDEGWVPRTSFIWAGEGYTYPFDRTYDLGYGVTLEPKLRIQKRLTHRVFSKGTFQVCGLEKSTTGGKPELWLELSTTRYSRGVTDTDTIKGTHKDSVTTLIDSERIMEQASRGFAQALCGEGASLALMVCR